MCILAQYFLKNVTFIQEKSSASKIDTTTIYNYRQVAYCLKKMQIIKWYTMKKILMLTFFLFLFSQNCFSAHLHSEKSYQQAWQEKYGGIVEYQNNDYTRVDVLTKTHAIEFDFAKKWAESIGQALYYQYKTGKRAKVVLIIENPQKDFIYYNRVKALSKIHDFDLEYVTPSILNLDCCNRCQYKDCRCRKYNSK